MNITTHILDIGRGKPAAHVRVQLERHHDSANWQIVAHGDTDNDGRIKNWNIELPAQSGTYRLTFAVEPYQQALGVQSFYPYVQIVFAVKNPREHFHVPLLLSPFGYSTYRGS